jgi:hypothetical protein
MPVEHRYEEKHRLIIFLVEIKENKHGHNSVIS